MSHEPVVVDLDAKITEALLGPAASKLTAAREALQHEVESARSLLFSHPLSKMVAEKAARDAGFRGTPEIVVSAAGQVAVSITRESTKWVSALPSLEALRKEAAALGVDISSQGRNKTDILKLLAAAKETRKPQPRPKRNTPPNPAEPRGAPQKSV